MGLGNPGKEYAGTRHNFGFMLVDALLEQAGAQPWGGPEKISSRKTFVLWRVNLLPPPTRPWLLLKPLTYMNLSGLAAAQVLAYYRLDCAALIAAHDEMDLPLGRMRFKFQGGSAGHKGVLSLEEHLGSRAFYRLRLGINRQTENNGALGHVLGAFNSAEMQTVDAVLREACAALPLFPELGFEATQRRINSFKAEAPS